MVVEEDQGGNGSIGRKGQKPLVGGDPSSSIIMQSFLN